MIKKTIYLGNAAYLTLKLNQLSVQFADLNEAAEKPTKMIPIEDIAVIILDNPQITITHALIQMLHAHNVSVISCDERHLPTGMFLTLEGHTLQQERFEAQIKASEPTKKQIWQQTVKAKIQNQGLLLNHFKKEGDPLFKMAQQVLSGDPTNLEARAAVYYWKQLGELLPQRITEYNGTVFFRDRMGPYPNALLNYAYSIVRGMVARQLSASGLLNTLGVFHRNRYNAYCLADDIMEPYRPYADQLVFELVLQNEKILELNKELKASLLALPVRNIIINGQTSPMMVGLQKTTSSLSAVFEGKERKVAYPVYE